MKLNDTHLVLLSAASQRDDGLVAPPETVAAASASKAMAALLEADLLAEVPVSAQAPAWREDEAGRPVGLRITAAGLGAIALSEGEGHAGAGGLDCAFPSCEESGRARGTERTAPSAARAGTKRALVLDLLCRPEGATLADLASATGWLPHTTRAALTGLRQDGHAITRSTNEAGQSFYHIEPASAAASEG
ncbi:DUF3489 domain-containing protein [Salinarimonas soli]|uniref:DUF3489 domain-containing protein n=1 Tax=Salinarimonas soli TaxID=1638099 RepID=A0A5B2VD90_9HYPH|nr:DUF3489 domain-containing protein [Salinarimonas soli]KAA2236440.1 DUF3489 domain-containing protein [Salinarimonas soli]